MTLTLKEIRSLVNYYIAENIAIEIWSIETIQRSKRGYHSISLADYLLLGERALRYREGNLKVEGVWDTIWNARLRPSPHSREVRPFSH